MIIPKYDDPEILTFISQLGLVNSQGDPFDFTYHSFLIDPLCDWHPQQGINKASQVGFSETIGVIKSLYAVKKYKMNILYTLPTDNFLRAFVPQKVDPIIQNNSHAFGDIKGGTYLKEGNKGAEKRSIFFMGAHNPKSSSKQEESSKGVAVSTDLNIHDEASKSDQFTIAQMRTRLDNSPYKGHWRFDNPTYPQMGADFIYQKSDQRHFFVKCSKCNYKQYMSWHRLDEHDFESGTRHCWIDTEKMHFLCGKCMQPISKYDRINGEWVAKYKDRTAYRGYWINQMMYVHHSVQSILEKEEDPSIPKSQFYNFTLGMPYSASDVKIDRADIVANMTGENPKKEKMAMGVDQGKVKWYVIGNHEGIHKVGWTKSWKEIEMLKNKYNCTHVADALPYQAEPKRLNEKYPKNSYRAFYKPETDQAELFKFGTKSDKNVVLIRRDEVFDELVDKIHQNNLPLHLDYNQEFEKFSEHWESMIRMTEEDSHGNMRFSWKSTNGEDHLAHATLYWYTALQQVSMGVGGVIKQKKRGGDKYNAVDIKPDGTMDQNVIQRLRDKQK